MGIVRRALILMVVAACAADAPKKSASPQLKDVAGTVRRPLEVGESRATVLLFIAVDCPVSNGYAPEINRIRQAYSDKKVAFYIVYPDADLTDDDAGKHAREYGYTCPALVDRRHELVKRVHATITPEAAVVGADGAILYRGRIDDRYIALGKRRAEPTTHDLRDALDAVLAGREVKTPRTAAIGCSIP